MNYSEVVDYDRTTSQVAELLVCWLALQKVFECTNEMYLPYVTEVVLKSDSAYVVRGITEWLPKWKCNGWVNSQGRRVANCDLWQNIDDEICKLEQKRKKVQFWKVARENNREADELAKAALARQRDYDALMLKLQPVLHDTIAYLEQHGKRYSALQMKVRPLLSDVTALLEDVVKSRARYA